MPAQSLKAVRNRIARRLEQMEREMPGLKPEEICAAMEAIRQSAAQHGLMAMEGLADWAAHHAMMPGYRGAVSESMTHWHEALEAEDANSRESILASLALRFR